jgi:Restriction endonuclease S subunits
VCIADEVPFEIPESWEWVRFSSIIELQSGQDMAPDKYNANGDGIPYITGASNIENGSVIINRWTEYGKAFAYKGDLLLTCKGTVGTMAILDEPQVHIARQIMAIRTTGEIGILYIQVVLETLVASLKAAAKSMIPGIAREDVLKSLLPLPPYAEQKRIVSKLSEIAQFVAMYSLRENALNRLYSSFPDQLRKSILQMAVQGKLIPQDPTDEPASVLLERIRAEKQRLVKEGKIKKDKHESVIFRRDNSHYEKLDGIERCIDDEIPFEIPKNWKWTRFGQVISLLSGTDFKPEEYNDKQQGVPYITGASSLSEHGVLINRWTEVPRVIVNRGDVLLVCKGSGYGKTVICDIDEAHIARQIMAIKKMTTLDMPYIRVFLQANFEQIKSKGQGVIPGIDRNSVLNLLFPLPPLLEQRHIVEKQRELFNAITLI